MPDKKHWGSLPFLQALRPEPDEVVDGAVIATYSVDLVVVAATLLALSGLDDDRGSGSKVDFANSFERLKDKFRVLCQRGRGLVPVHTAMVLKMMDRFVREVGADEQKLAWHPKAVLARYRRENGNPSWRVWLGSRNLTKSLAWELGMLIVSDDHGQPIPGVSALGEILARRAELDCWSASEIKGELDSLRWRTPQGIRIDEIRLWDMRQVRALPDAPEALRRLVIIGPYLDGSVVNKLGHWGEAKTERLVVSTIPELKKLSSQTGTPLAHFSDGLRYLDSPDAEEDSDIGESAASSEEELESRGLHAKLIYAEHKRGRTLWMGSANITERAWSGPNAEVIARASIDDEVARGLDAFLEYETRELPLGELTKLADLLDPDQEKLDEIRTRLAASWNLRQAIKDGEAWLCGDYDPHDLDPELRVEAGRFGERLGEWPAGQCHIASPLVEPDLVTEIVVISLHLHDKHCRWSQIVPIAGFDRDRRDRALMVQYLDARTFLSWVRSLLDDSFSGAGGGDWDSPRTSQRTEAEGGADVELWAPSLEQALKTWIRNPGQLRHADSVIANYLLSVRERNYANLTSEEINVLNALDQTWRVIRRELIPGPRARASEAK